MLRAIVKLMCGERGRRRVVDKLVALTFRHSARAGCRLSRRRSRLMPSLPAVVGALDDLSKPSAGLRGINAIRVSLRALQAIHFPSRKMWSAHVPLVAFAVRRKNECALLRADQNPDSA